MLLEIIGFWGLMELIMFAFAEFFKRKEIALIASLLLIVLGLLILVDGIQIQTGTVTTEMIGML